MVNARCSVQCQAHSKCSRNSSLISTQFHHKQRKLLKCRWDICHIHEKMLWGAVLHFLETDKQTDWCPLSCSGVAKEGSELEALLGRSVQGSRAVLSDFLRCRHTQLHLQSQRRVIFYFQSLILRSSLSFAYLLLLESMQL